MSEWLENLQRESWQLELLISGFSIFLLVQAIPGLQDYRLDLLYGSDRSMGPIIANLFLLIIQLGCLVLALNLVIHVILRGIWIGTVGLRSIENKGDIDSLSYSTFFTEKLKKSVRSLDELIIRLDNICSVIFAFTFLLIFMTLSLFMFMLVVSLMGVAMSTLYPDGPEDIPSWGMLVIMLIFLLFGIIYLIDTLSLGFFKKHNSIARIYYPIYKVLGVITLAFIYRGIYYNLLNRFSKNRIRAVLIPYILLITLGPFHTINYHTFFPDNETDFNIYSYHYEQELEEDERIGAAAIPSRIIEDDWLPLFVTYRPTFNETLLKMCDNYTPSKTSTFVSGISFDNGIQITDPDVDEEDPEKLLGCLVNYFDIYINDSLYQQQDFYFQEHPNGEKGIFTMLNISDLPMGKHQVRIDRKYYDKEDQLKNRKYIRFPFWLQK